MFVVTADQKDSRSDVDRAQGVLDDLNDRFGAVLELPVDRTAGDEVQALLPHAADALAMVLDLTRREHWSVGLGIGRVRTPLPADTRAATGEAFIAARDAVDAAKRSPTRFALAVEGGGDSPGTAPDGITSDEVEALITLLLLARDRRTEQGWEVADRMAAGVTQRDVAAELSITPQAVSTRLRTAGWRTEQAALPGLAKLLAHLDTAVTRKDDTA
ncbi:DNA-binding protein [Microbacteriaceae bacterium 4G12]